MKRRIAPRLANGDPRERVYIAWPAEVKKGLQAAAAARKESANWLAEKLFCDMLKIRQPKYVKPKTRGTVVPMKRRA